MLDLVVQAQGQLGRRIVLTQGLQGGQSHLTVIYRAVLLKYQQQLRRQQRQQARQVHQKLPGCAAGLYRGQEVQRRQHGLQAFNLPQLRQDVFQLLLAFLRFALTRGKTDGFGNTLAPAAVFG